MKLIYIGDSELKPGDKITGPRGDSWTVDNPVGNPPYIYVINEDGIKMQFDPSHFHCKWVES